MGADGVGQEHDIDVGGSWSLGPPDDPRRFPRRDFPKVAETCGSVVGMSLPKNAILGFSARWICFGSAAERSHLAGRFEGCREQALEHSSRGPMCQGSCLDPTLLVTPGAHAEGLVIGDGVLVEVPPILLSFRPYCAISITAVGDDVAANRSASRLEPLGAAWSALGALLVLNDLAEVRAVVAGTVSVGEAAELREIDEALVVGDLFDAGDLEPLPLLERLHERRSAEE